MPRFDVGCKLQIRKSNMATNRTPRKVREMLESFIHKSENTDGTNSSTSENEDAVDSRKSYNPTSRSLFLERVKSFSSVTWVAKPTELSPMQCARYGWINDENDQLKCLTCSASLFAGFPDQWDSETYKETCQRLQSKLKNGHNKLCPWQESCCPVSFMNLPHQSKEQWISFLKNSFSGLLMLGKEMPLLNEDALEEMGLAERGVIQELLEIVNHQKTTDEQNLFARTAVALAICGWKACDEIKQNITIFCDTCGKECGLWNYVKVTEDLTPLSGKRILHGNEADNLDARQIYASFISDRSTFRSSEFISSNVSMHSETDSQMSENGLNESKTIQMNNDKTTSNQHNIDVREEAIKYEIPLELQSGGSNEDSKMIKINEGNPQFSSQRESRSNSYTFTEPLAPYVGKMELMKALLLATAPGEQDISNQYSESLISEVGSEAFEKRLEIAKEELSHEVTSNQDPDPPPPPPANQENLMKELLFVTAPKDGSPKGSISVFSEVGSLMFDKRLDTWSVCSPRSGTPTFKDKIDFFEEENNSRKNTLESKVKRMRFHDPSHQTFSVLDEHHNWCPMVIEIDNSSNEQSPKENPIPGWKRVLFSLLNYPNRNDRFLQGSPDEMWKSVRKLLQDCSSPVNKKN